MWSKKGFCRRRLQPHHFHSIYNTLWVFLNPFFKKNVKNCHFQEVQLLKILICLKSRRLQKCCFYVAATFLVKSGLQCSIEDGRLSPLTLTIFNGFLLLVYIFWGQFEDVYFVLYSQTWYYKCNKVNLYFINATISIWYKIETVDWNEISIHHFYFIRHISV